MALARCFVYYPSLVPNVAIERVSTPGGEMVLFRRGTAFSIRVGTVELMNSLHHGSEDELGRLTSERVASVSAPRLLIGGLGLGYTARAALDALPATAHVDIVEIVPEVVRWNRTILGGLANHPLADPRVHVIEDDVANVIQRSDARYHAILLDVDNGPDGVFQGNSGLYRRAGLVASFRALAPEGVLAVWSSFQSPRFTTWLREVGGGEVEVTTIRSQCKGGGRHYIWFAHRRPARPSTTLMVAKPSKSADSAISGGPARS